jgi:transcriptional regulator with XRE-family HTH domain
VNCTAKKHYKICPSKKYCHFVTLFFIIADKAVILLQINTVIMADKAKRRTKQEMKALYDYAKMLFVYDKLSQKEISTKTGVSEVTISKWVRDDKWDDYRKAISVTRDERYRSTINQLTELDNLIKSRDENYRFPSKEESNIRRRLVADLTALEVECGIVDVINVSIKLLEWLRQVDNDKAKEISDIFNSYIKSTLK